MPRPLNNQSIEIILPNQLGFERIAMACSATFAKMFGFSPERIEDLKTIVAEAAINAMQHGNKERPDARVTVSMNFKDDTIHVAVKDEGEGIKEQHHVSPSLISSNSFWVGCLIFKLSTMAFEISS